MVERRNGGATTWRTSSTSCTPARERCGASRPTATISRAGATLFADVRCYFPVARQQQVYSIIERYIAFADEFLASLHRPAAIAEGNPLQCRALTRKGTACQRTPLAHNGYCPSHQHLAETEHAAPAALAA